MKSVDVSRSFFDHLDAFLAASTASSQRPSIAVDREGEEFDPQRLPKWWIEPQCIESIHPTESRPNGEEADSYRFRIRGFVKSQQKGGRFLTLETLIDFVREAVDVSEGAPSIIRVMNAAAPPVQVGSMGFGEVRIVRAFGVSETIKGTPVHGLDRFSLELQTTVAGAAGGVC